MEWGLGSYGEGGIYSLKHREEEKLIILLKVLVAEANGCEDSDH